jgi:hypothetical protein
MGGFAQGLKNLLEWQPSGSPAWMNQQQASLAQRQKDIDQEQADTEAKKSQSEEVLHMIQQGAKPLGPGGLVAESAIGPDGNPVTTYRPPDPDRHVATYKAGWKGATPADDVQLEIPTQQEQQLAAAIQKNTLDAGQAQVMGPINAANDQALLEAQGRAAANVRAAQTVPASTIITPGGQLQPDAPITPQEGMTFAGKGAAANVRAKSAAEIQQDKDAAAADRLKSRMDAAAALNDTKAQAEAAREQNQLDYKDRWERAKNSLSANTQSNLNNRVLMQQFSENQKQHGLLQDQSYKEQQKQLDAQALIDPKSGAQDGEEFTNPFDGKKTTMNAAQRTRLSLGLGASQAQVQDLKNRAGQIEQRYGLSGQPAQGGGGQAASGGAPVATPKPAVSAPAATPGKPPKGTPKVINGANYVSDGTQWVLQKK